MTSAPLPPRPAAPPARAPRRLTLQHFAFMRALAQGLDARASWERYLRHEAERVDERRIRSEIDWLRTELAAAARRDGRPGTARLVQMDASRVPERAAALPTLEAFAAEHGLEDFSSAEQQQAYEDAFGVGAAAPAGARRSVGRRRRLVERQLQAIQWLEGRAAARPAPHDRVEEWLAPFVSERLRAAGLDTLASSRAFISLHGHRWYRLVPGIGRAKAQRIVAWMQAHAGPLGSGVLAYIQEPRSALSAAQKAQTVPAQTGLVPLEKLVAPPQPGGGRCTIELLSRWVQSHPHSATRRAYRGVVEKLLLWWVVEEGRAASQLALADLARWLDFLQRPPPHWLGPRCHPRWSPLWRPMERPLSGTQAARTRRIATAAIRALVCASSG